MLAIYLVNAIELIILVEWNLNYLISEFREEIFSISTLIFINGQKSGIY